MSKEGKTEPGPDSPERTSELAPQIRKCPSTNTLISLSYTTSGDPADPPLLLINGLNANFMMYDEEFVSLLVKEGPFYVIRFDNRDCGFSTKLSQFGDPSLVKQLFPKCCSCCCGVKTVYGLEDMADDAVALLDYLKIDKAHILGTSMGGMIAQQVAIRHPDRCLSLTSMKSTTGADDLARPSFWHQIKLIQGPTQAEDLEEWSKNLAHWMVEVMWPEGSIKDEDKLKGCEAWTLNQMKYCRYDGGNARQLTAIVQAEPRDDMLKQCKVPALVLHGELDMLVPLAHGERTAKCLPNCQKVVIPTMAHNFYPPLYPAMVQAIVNRAKTASVAPLGPSEPTN